MDSASGAAVRFEGERRRRAASHEPCRFRARLGRRGGFGPQRRWDWLHLLLFAVVLVLLPEWIRKGQPLRGWARAAAVLGVVGFVIVVVGGYRWGWSWTGFRATRFATGSTC